MLLASESPWLERSMVALALLPLLSCSSSLALLCSMATLALLLEHSMVTLALLLERSMVALAHH